MAKVQRNSHIELLRIAAMLMIVAHHYAAFGFYAEDLAFSRNKIFVDLFGMCSRVGVDLFVLITGYYTVTARFRLKKILTLMGTVWFYTLGMLLVFLLAGLTAPDRAILISSFFPLLTSHYWFASYYVLLLLLAPFLNEMVTHLSRRQHLLLCALMVTLCMLMPQFLRIVFAGGMLPLMVTLYLCGAFIRLHVPAEERIGRRCLVLALALLLLISLWVGVSDSLAQRADDYARLERSTELMDQVYSPFAFAVAALLLPAAVCRRETASNLWVNLVGGLTFGVYLFHTGQLLSAVMWQRVFHTSAFVDSPWLPLHAVGTVAVIFVVGCLIERLRQVSVGRLWERFVDALLRRLKMNDWIKGA